MSLGRKKLPWEILQRWFHSYEDDMPDVLVYRNANYTFPLSRNRRGFEFKEDGTFIRYDIGSDDLPRKVFGHWELDEKNKIRILIEGKKIYSNILEVISYDKNVLKIKKSTQI